MIKLKLTMEEVINAYQALSAISGNASLDMTWAIDDIKEVLEKHNKRFNEERTRLLEEHGEKNALGNYTVKRDKMTSFTDKMKAMGEVEVNIEVEPLDYDVVVVQGVQIPIASAKILRSFIVKQKVEKPPVKEKPVRKIQPHKAPEPVGSNGSQETKKITPS